jgi:hypothetical protein
MTNKNYSKKQREYNRLLSQIRELSMIDVLNLYFEATTGHNEDVSLLFSGHIYDALEDVENIIKGFAADFNSLYADSIINSALGNQQ